MNKGSIGPGAMGMPTTAKLTAAFPGSVFVFNPSAVAVAASVSEFGVTAGQSIADVAGHIEGLQ